MTEKSTPEIMAPDKVRRELAAANDAAAREVDPDMQRAYLRIGRICRDYITLWDRNKELEERPLGRPGPEIVEIDDD